MLNWSRTKCKLGGITNSSFLALVPKEANTSGLARFGPIGLCNYSYKIQTKIIASKLKSLFPSLIFENQGGFLSKRNIFRNIILVQEAIHSSLQSKTRGHGS